MLVKSQGRDVATGNATSCATRVLEDAAYPIAQAVQKSELAVHHRGRGCAGAHLEYRTPSPTPRWRRGQIDGHHAYRRYRKPNVRELDRGGDRGAQCGEVWRLAAADLCRATIDDGHQRGGSPGVGHSDLS